MDGFTCLSYCAKMLNRMEWGSVIEIATAAEIFINWHSHLCACSEKALFHVVGVIQVYWI